MIMEGLLQSQRSSSKELSTMSGTLMIKAREAQPSLKYFLTVRSLRAAGKVILLRITRLRSLSTKVTSKKPMIQLGARFL